MIKRHLRGFALAAALLLGSTAMVRAEMVYHRGNTAEPETLDQHLTSTIYESNILRDLYEGLVIDGADGSVQPGVAESWSVSDDGLVYTFKLRDDAKWSNGDPVTADDFVFSYRRILDPATGAKYADVLFPIAGAKMFNSGEGRAEDVGVKAVDSRTVEITLASATPYFLQLLTHQTSLPVHPGTVQSNPQDFTKPGVMVSNGPYMLDEWVPNSHIKSVRNPNFHDADTVAIDTVYYYPTEDRSAALRRFEAGELDSNNDGPVEQMDYMREKLGDTLRIAPYLGTYYYTVNTDKAPFDDVRVRQALSMVIDREFLAHDIWGDTMVAGYSLVPPGIDNYGEPAYFSYKDTPLLDREDQAIALMKEAGFGPDHPLEVDIRFNTSENHQKTATAIADMWKPLGVETTLTNADTKTHYAILRDRGDYDIARAGWIGDYNDPQNFLFLLESDNTGLNYARYQNPEYDALMHEAAATVDLDVRAGILKQAEEIFSRDVPYIPLLYYGSISLVSDRLKGWEDNLRNVHPSRFMSIGE
ncbi:MAG: peptide ABC transporter substrate-binding protein [Geminicoccaceae bacterium]|nr:peptide ABC transporter substrate-binding protein [Geminicoccaceae bacterium]